MAKRYWVTATAALALSGCATRGPISLSCPIFDSTVTPMPLSRLERDIQADAGDRLDLLGPPPPPPLVNHSLTQSRARLPASDPLREAFRRAEPQREASITPGATEALRRQTAPQPVTALLLSGGGQWGAFGAGFLKNLQASPAAIDPQIITGVSTGGLQSLFVTVGTPAAYAALESEYSPGSQAQLVTTNSTLLTAITGSMAGIKPLRRAIERALCNGGDPARDCPMIEALAASPRQAFIGFVQAKSGQFLIADVNAMARHATAASPGTPARTAANLVARDCLTGAALASAGMPLFFQPVRINRHVYYDGGVRQSVFLSAVADAAAASMVDESGQSVGPPPTLYVIRNGPTQLLGANGKPGDNDKVDEQFDALTAALRTQSIIVNQVEVGSIAALRLFHPQGAINLATADGYQNHVWTDADGKQRRCDKGKERFFNPDFMACLRSLGRAKAQRPSPWISLTPLSGARAPARSDPAR